MIATHDVFRHRFLRNFEPPTSYEEFEAAFIPLIDEQKKQTLIDVYDENYGENRPENIKIVVAFMEIIIESVFEDVKALKPLQYRFNFTHDAPDIWVASKHVAMCEPEELHRILRLINSWEAVSSFLHASSSFEYPEFAFLINRLESEIMQNYDDYAYNPNKDEIDTFTNVVVLITSINHEYAKSDEQK